MGLGAQNINIRKNIYIKKEGQMYKTVASLHY